MKKFIITIATLLTLNSTCFAQVGLKSTLAPSPSFTSTTFTSPTFASPTDTFTSTTVNTSIENHCACFCRKGPGDDKINIKTDKGDLTWEFEDIKDADVCKKKNGEKCANMKSGEEGALEECQTANIGLE